MGFKARLSEQISIKFVYEKAKAITHAFPNPSCLYGKLLVSVKPHLRNRTGLGKSGLEFIMAGDFKEAEGMVDSNSTFVLKRDLKPYYIYKKERTGFSST